MEAVQICDNFLNEEDMKTCKEYFNKNIWEFGQYSITSKAGNNPPFFRSDLTNNPFFSEYLKARIEQIVGKTLNVSRIYASGQTYGNGGLFHTDADEDGHFTFCLYINGFTNQEIIDTGGTLDFKFRDSNYIIQHNTFNNRGIFFDATIPHRGNAYDVDNVNLRICVSWKF